MHGRRKSDKEKEKDRKDRGRHSDREKLTGTGSSQ